MTINPDVKTILCFGDSNTYGQMPASYERFSGDMRWTGILQGLLGSGYKIIEEGLAGRTVTVDDPDHPSKNGTAYFKRYMDSPMSLSLVVIMLGTNDLTVTLGRSVEEIVNRIEDIAQIALTRRIRTVLVSPIILNHEALERNFYGEVSFDEVSENKSRQLVAELRRLSLRINCAFVAGSDVSSPGSDGVHMDAKAHRVFAEMIAKRLKKIL